jgi:hypothetical protein
MERPFVYTRGVIRRLWIVVSVIWTLFWTYLYVISGPLTPEEHLNLRASTTLVMAVPWVLGALVQWIVKGGKRQ